MKKIIMAAAVAATMCLTSCSGKSEASREQIANGHEQAKEMLRKTDAPQPAPASTPGTSATTPSPATVSAPQTPADSVQ